VGPVESLGFNGRTTTRFSEQPDRFDVFCPSPSPAGRGSANHYACPPCLHRSSGIYAELHISLFGHGLAGIWPVVRPHPRARTLGFRGLWQTPRDRPHIRPSPARVHNSPISTEIVCFPHQSPVTIQLLAATSQSAYMRNCFCELPDFILVTAEKRESGGRVEGSTTDALAPTLLRGPGGRVTCRQERVRSPGLCTGKHNTGAQDLGIN
jgi:hypothetical protein